MPDFRRIIDNKIKNRENRQGKPFSNKKVGNWRQRWCKKEGNKVLGKEK